MPDPGLCLRLAAALPLVFEGHCYKYFTLEVKLPTETSHMVKLQVKGQENYTMWEELQSCL